MVQSVENPVIKWLESGLTSEDPNVALVAQRACLDLEEDQEPIQPLIGALLERSGGVSDQLMTYRDRETHQPLPAWQRRALKYDPSESVREAASYGVYVGTKRKISLAWQ